MSKDYINYSTVGNTIRENLCIQLRNQQTCNSENPYEIRRGPILNPIFVGGFIIDLLMQNKFCGVNLISRSWRT